MGCRATYLTGERTADGTPEENTLFCGCVFVSHLTPSRNIPRHSKKNVTMKKKKKKKKFDIIIQQCAKRTGHGNPLFVCCYFLECGEVIERVRSEGSQ